MTFNRLHTYLIMIMTLNLFNSMHTYLCWPYYKNVITPPNLFISYMIFQVLVALWPTSFLLENLHHSPNTGALNSKIIFNFSFPFNCHGRYHNWSHTYSFLYSISFIISSPKVRSISSHTSLRSSIVYHLAVKSSIFSISSTSYVALQVDHPLIQFYTYHSMFKIMVPFSHCTWLQ